MRMERRPRVFVDADVLFAGAASPGEHGASLVVLRLGEITLIEAVTSTQAVVECERNLADKLPLALPAFRHLVSRALHVVPDPTPAQVEAFAGRAHAEDLPILVAAARGGCPYLVTFNVRHFQPGIEGVSVMPPGNLVAMIRERLTFLSDSDTS